ncbi:hypothetical protein TYRP_005257 [Tyrophagus putrescentiae]|nr:hypothetical protein TYRP_005257 [Tyrophagus putrescentiae]
MSGEDQRARQLRKGFIPEPPPKKASQPKKKETTTTKDSSPAATEQPAAKHPLTEPPAARDSGNESLLDPSIAAPPSSSSSDNMGDNNNKQSPSTDSSSSAYKVPAFIEKSPTAWVRLCKAQFTLLGITDEEAQYNRVLAGLPSKLMVEQVIEVIDSDFAQGHLEKLFAAIIDAFTTSPTERLRDVLDKEEQGTRKPSVFFKALKNKVVNMNVSDDVVYDRWLCKLSIPIQSAVVGAKALPNMTLDNLLQLADNIYEHLSTTGQQVSAVHHHNNNNRNRSHSRDHRHRHHRHRSPSRGRSPSASRYNEGGRWCYNHFTYRDKANKCGRPGNCTFQSQYKRGPKN